jgi:hypothetical protein
MDHKDREHSGKAERHKAHNLMKDELRIGRMPRRLRI